MKKLTAQKDSMLFFRLKKLAIKGLQWVYFFSLIFLIEKLKGQTVLLDSSNYYNCIQNYYNSINYNPLDTSEGGANNSLIRHRKMWELMLYPHGSFKKYNEFNYSRKFPNNNTAENNLLLSNCNNNNLNWTNIPLIMPSNPIRYMNRVNVQKGQMNRIVHDPRFGDNTANGVENKTLFAASIYGGLWKSLDGGDTWVNISDRRIAFTSVTDIAFNPNNPDEIFVVTGSKIDNLWQFGNKWNSKSTFKFRNI